MIAPRPYVDHCSLCPRVSCAPRWSLHRHGTCWPHCACSCSLQSPFVVPRRADRGAEDATSHLACCSASALSHVSAASTPPLRRGLLPRVRGSPWAAHGALPALIATEPSSPPSKSHHHSALRNATHLCRRRAAISQTAVGRPFHWRAALSCPRLSILWRAGLGFPRPSTLWRTDGREKPYPLRWK